MICRSPMRGKLPENKDLSSFEENLISALKMEKKTHDLKPWKCSPCGKTFMSVSSLTRHMKCHVEDKPREHQGYPEKLYKCKECGKAFVSPSAVRTHESSHTGKKPYECLQCGKVFPY